MRLAFLVTCALIMFACSGSHHDHDAAPDGGEEASVLHDGFEADGDDGLVHLKFASSAALARTGNEFSVTVTDPKGAAITGAGVSWEFNGPTADLTANATSTEAGSGVYRSPKVDFPASGAWTVRIHVIRASPEIHDHATFRLSVP